MAKFCFLQIIRKKNFGLTVGCDDKICANRLWLNTFVVLLAFELFVLMEFKLLLFFAISSNGKGVKTVKQDGDNDGGDGGTDNTTVVVGSTNRAENAE